ncbi:glycoside hydrolase [Saccharobesus litoralis]|uniref:Glycoside hydrolase n=1 Tax=Saccharobesus litoralis TaxID=2172099 RepID=A0A2S0VVX8_9ALTE|nr:glycoside hydrolase [Saccharobesus litoralis]AWB68260.1 glycoside hydrolase [Saccharobesus litoralis]
MRLPPVFAKLSSHLRILGLLPTNKTKLHQANVTLVSNEVVHQVAPEYLSFAIDISVVVGGYWWEGSQGVRKGLGTLRVPPLDLRNKKLDRLVQALGQSYVRVGGSEADKIFYFNSPTDNEHALVLTKTMWDQLHQFIQRNQLKFVFTCKYGLFSRKEHGDWQGDEVQQLLQYSIDQGYQIDVCELGNELNAYWAFHGVRSQPGGKNLAQDYATFAEQIKCYYPQVKIMGPGSAYWPKLGETLAPLSNLTKKFLAALSFNIDIIDWHYYPFQSKRSPLRTRTANLRTLLSPKSFSDFDKYSAKLKAWRDTYQPQAEFWTGETGSAQCGGQPQLSDRFASCFWWADQLGRGAAHGQKVMIRQSLIGGDYGMINRLTTKPRPDYWVSWLWVRLMGQGVFEVKTNVPRVRVYCHQHPDGNHKTLMLINLINRPVEIELTGFAELQQAFSVTANKITSKKVLINGIKPRFKKGKVRLEDFQVKTQTNPEIPALSINFWCFS